MTPLYQTDIFTLSLGLMDSWLVTNVEVFPLERDPIKLEVHISVDWKGGGKSPRFLPSASNLDTAIAYNYRSKLQGIYEDCVDLDQAVEVYETWCLEMWNSGVKEIRKASQTLTNNDVEILNFFITRRTNAMSEGFSSVIGLIEKRARGYKNMYNFMALIYPICREPELPKATIM